MTNVPNPSPLGINPYFHDLLGDMLYCYRLHCAELYTPDATDPPEQVARMIDLRNAMLTKADLFERWLDPVPAATEGGSK